MPPDRLQSRLLGKQDLHARIGEDVADALGRKIRIQRDVARTSLEDGEQGHEKPWRSSEADADQRARHDADLHADGAPAGWRARRGPVAERVATKWAEVSGGRIVSFRTFMTGEVFGALKDHTILGRLMRAGAAQDGFARGVREGWHSAAPARCSTGCSRPAATA